MAVMAPQIFAILCLLVATGQAELTRVQRVIDGDTIVLANDDTIRIVGIEASEFLRTPKPRPRQRNMGSS
jgi:endonuclease YncB( thermonuclease family)